ncbi:hypothetical protein GCM10023205_02930 [Yinghuangia aomiensis]|uniref:DUF7144 domain-containing protein n=1 Tax=Yinghuangia aomiensis TaxID=676205 RepID=A0ABP9GTZ4_9ACTN
MSRNSGGFNAWSGWVAFAAFTLLVLGILNLFQGLTALFRNGYYVVANDQLLLRSYTTWGVILLCFAALQLATGMGLLAGASWSRYVAIALAMLNIIGEIAFIAAHPAWSIVVIALDVVVLYALTAKWEMAQGMNEESMSRAEAAEWQASQAADRSQMGSTERHPPAGGMGG